MSSRPGIKVNLEIMDRRGNQNTQNSAGKIVSFPLGIRCDLRQYGGSLSSIVCHQQGDGCRDAGAVFFNREPVEEDMKRWEHLYYVGADAKESAVLEGQILVDAYQEESGIP
ncbi:MAG: hypothetical protein ACLR8P_11475 [Clostridium fessum]